MTNDVLERPATPLENRRVKARALALYLWRTGMTVGDVRGLPYASRDRSVRTMSRFARAAFAASPRPEAREKDPPDGRASQTWAIAEEKLEEIEAMARRGEPVPDRDLLGERHLWNFPPAEEPTAATQTDVEAEADDLLTEAAPAVAELEVAGDPFAILGRPCPECGWRRGLHRPGGERLLACPRWAGIPAGSGR